MNKQFEKNEVDYIKTKMDNAIPILVYNEKLKKYFKIAIKQTFKLIDIYNIIRRKLKLNKEEQLLFFIAGKLFVIDFTLLQVLYAVYKNKNEVLEIYYSIEAAFG